MLFRSGLRADYSWVHNADGSWTIADLRTGGPDATDTLWNIELLQFSDTVTTIDSYTPPPTVSNIAPTMTSTAPTVSLTEWADKSANEVANTPHTASGTITYSDSDVGDIHSASFKPEGTGYLGTFTLNTGSIDSADSVGWSFTVSDSAINYLKAGQSLTQKYDVAIDDGHGGTTMQTVTVTLVGTDDAVTRGGGSGKGGKGSEPAQAASATDVLFFLDMQHDQAPAPEPFNPYVGVDVPELALSGLAELYESKWSFA